MTFIVTKGGGIRETGAKEIPLSFTRDHLVMLLCEIINESSRYSHQDFANWASKFHMYCVDAGDNGEEVDDKLEDLLLDIDMQWNCFLFNSYEVKELLKIDLSKEKLPKEMLNEWLTTLV